MKQTSTKIGRLLAIGVVGAFTLTAYACSQSRKNSDLDTLQQTTTVDIKSTISGNANLSESAIAAGGETGGNAAALFASASDGSGGDYGLFDLDLNGESPNRGDMIQYLNDEPSTAQVSVFLGYAPKAYQTKEGCSGFVCPSNAADCDHVCLNVLNITSCSVCTSNGSQPDSGATWPENTPTGY